MSEVAVEGGREAEALQRVAEREAEAMLRAERERLEKALRNNASWARSRVEGRGKELRERAEREIEAAYEEWPLAEREAEFEALLEQEIAEARERLAKHCRRLGFNEGGVPKLEPETHVVNAYYNRVAPVYRSEAFVGPEALREGAEAQVARLEREALGKVEEAKGGALALLSALDPRSDDAKTLPGSLPPIDDLMPAKIRVKGLVRRRPAKVR